MAKVIADVDDAIELINTLYEGDDDVPTSGEEDYTIWLSLLNVAVTLWESEEGVLWEELFVKLDDAADGDKTASADDFSYDCPTDFVFQASGYVWIGDNTNKTPYKVIKREEVQLRENDSENWCYFIRGGSPTLEFNPNCDVVAGTIRYNYYKHATKLTSGSDTFEMSDPMFAIAFAVNELRRDEGDSSMGSIASQVLEAMKVKNVMPTWFQDGGIDHQPGVGFGT